MRIRETEKIGQAGLLPDDLLAQPGRCEEDRHEQDQDAAGNCPRCGPVEQQSQHAAEAHVDGRNDRVLAQELLV
jgi:hypothetical protein